MKGVNNATDLIIENNPMYSLMIKSGIVNYTSLARKIKKQVESMTGKEVKLNTLVKYITSITPGEKEDYQINYLKKSNLDVEFKFAEKEGKEFDPDREDVFLVYKTQEGFKFLVRNDPEGNLACIRITLPPEAKKAPGITLFVVEFLSMQQISIEKIYRFDLEIILVCSVEVASKVISSLSDLIFKSYL
ncbi:MAG: hypothetical protein B2I18_00405 [Cuniculiplasma sp. C_DKE]|jgi:hypothetical protein|uniref:ACT domain containing protein n=1 Tax=Cuniculiplasma divulgatum TaxID=1673428 RepID=A0A1R4A9Q7_9ARCH|nr:hypothetical protein [Cuniculiplasma divulgatum]EQB68754.1 MAG: aspartokinase beta subunit [Thermoplasmatales archaeon Gpl]OWP55644.1 MAG: hypothetical protein B2I18_00405 [Cuniculiplasma sp. C_DKE]WMT50109.1 MAG: hypothetical protein RE472_03850 [Thermoplasmatales archaeon]SJK85703.1 ACT domain containing protein [Cuniculiplasma divulgatum]